MFSNPWLYSSGGDTSLLHLLNTGFSEVPVKTYALSASLVIIDKKNKGKDNNEKENEKEKEI